MNNAVQEIREKLHAIRDVCVNESKDLRRQLAEAEKELEQVDAALTAIGEKPGRSTAKKRSSGKPRLPCATKEEVLSAIHETLADNGQLPEGDLKDLAGEKLRGRGKSLSMFARLFAKCLEDPSLEPASGGGYVLAGQCDPAVNKPARKVGF